MKKAAEAVTASAPGAEGLWKRPAPRPLASSASSSLTRSGAGEVVVAFACFLVLCAAVLSHPTKLVEQDAYAYRASIVALSEGHVTLSTNQYEELRRRLVASDGGYGIGIGQWVHLADGRWVSEKNPGYPFFAVPFQLIGALRLAPLFYAALACAGLFFGGRRWLGRWGGTWAAGLFCSSGAALLFAWRETMPTFTESSLLAAGTGAVLWAVLAGDAGARARTIVGLLGFLALEGAVFVRYTDVVVLACGVAGVLAAGRLASVSLPRRALFWWVGSVVLFGVVVLTFDRFVYGHAFSTGYGPGVFTFGLRALSGNLAHMPLHLTKAMPAFWLALLGIVCIAARDLRLRGLVRADARLGRVCANDARAALPSADRDLAVGASLAASWLGIWGLYAMYYWSARTSAGAGSTLQVVRFFVPSLAPIALLAAWPLARAPRRLAGAALLGFFALGLWSFTAVRTGDFVTSGGMPRGTSVSSGGGSAPGAPPRAQLQQPGRQQDPQAQGRQPLPPGASAP